MQKRNSIVNIPLFGGIVLSIALHAAALYSRGIYTPASPQLEAGRTVVQLTLIPSMAVQAVEPEPVIEKDPEPSVEPYPEPIVAPVPVPAPETVVEPAAEPETEPVPESPKEPVQETMPEPVEESIEQLASTQDDKGVITQATPVVGIRASYPRSSQRRGHQGTVVLSIQVLKNGKAGTIKILTSSGFQRLDEAAVQAAKAASYTPAEQFGQPVESQLTQPVTFKLTS